MNKDIARVVAGVGVGVLLVYLASVYGQLKLVWYVTRATGLLGFFLLAGSVLLSMFKRILAAKWKGIGNLHCRLSYWGLAFAAIHGLSTVFDKYLWGSQIGISRVFIPGMETDTFLYIGFGTVGLYLLILLVVTSVKPLVGKLKGKWRAVHVLGYIGFLLILLHGYYVGSESARLYLVYLVLFVFVLGYFINRLLGVALDYAKRK